MRFLLDYVCPVAPFFMRTWLRVATCQFLHLQHQCTCCNPITELHFKRTELHNMFLTVNEYCDALLFSEPVGSKDTIQKQYHFLRRSDATSSQYWKIIGHVFNFVFLFIGRRQRDGIGM